MIHGVKLQRLYEQHMESDPERGSLNFGAEMHGLLGISEGADGQKRIDYKARALNPREFSLQEVAYGLLGRDYMSRIREAFHVAQVYRLYEADGHAVLPSHFSNINAFTSTVTGLLEAMVLEALDNPEFIGDQMVQTEPTRVNGGKAIGVRNDGTGGEDNLLDDEPYPMVGLKETWVDVPENERHGQAVQLNEKVFLYDRTGQVQGAVDNASKSTLRQKEIRIADMVLGITNPYVRDGQASNTYRTAAGDAPNNYINSSTNEFVNRTDLQEAMNIMNGNVDPHTGWEVTVPLQGSKLLVDIDEVMKTREVLRATEVERRYDTQSIIQRGPNPLEYVPDVVASKLWYNRLRNAGVSVANSHARWYWGQFPKAFKYRQLIPFQSQPAPLSAEEVRRDIVGVWVVREHGVGYVASPWHVYRGTKE